MALGAFALLTAPAAAADEFVQTSGSIVYSWHGDPARGCAQLGLCGVRGTLVIQPQGGAQVVTFPFEGTSAMFDSVSADVRVQEGDLDAGGACVDELAGGPAELSLDNGPNGAVTAGSGGMPSSGRCAGPLAQELGRILIRGRRSHTRPTTYDLRDSVPFAAGPFTGTLDSTLVLRPEPPGAGGSSVSVSSGSSVPSPAHAQLVEQVLLRYRVSAPPAALGIAFGGESGPFCIPLGTCGARGSLSVAFPRLLGEVDIMAIRLVKARVSRRQALRDFRAGKLDLVGAPPLSWATPRVSETFRDGGTCTDTVPVPTYGLGFGFTAPPSRRALPVTISSFDNGTGADPLRTHCPGPGAIDALAPNETLASGRIRLRALLRRRLTLTLRARGGFSVPGYAGARAGELPVTLSLLKVIAGTQTERSP
jgi:hypothetical protein